MIPGETERAMGLQRPFLRSSSGIALAARRDATEDEVPSLREGATGDGLRALEDRPPSRRAAFLTGRSLLRELIAAADPAPGGHGDRPGSPRLIEAVCSDCGGPHGPVRIDGFLASVSHAGGVTAVAVLADTDAHTAGVVGIGLDLEVVPVDQERADAIRALLGEPHLSDVLAVRRWTEAEAVLKAEGRGLRVSPDAVVITGGTGGRIARISDRPGLVFEIHEVDVGSGFVASLAVARREC